jgi:tetratricopeptide (TPR) repeat protein
MEILKKPIAHLILIAAFGLVAYSNTFDVPFQLDDDINIVENPLIKDLGNYISPSRETGVHEDIYTQFISRIVGYLTFTINYKIHGFDVAGYHIFNLAVHLLNALLIYGIMLTIFKTPFLKDYNGRGLAPKAAFFSGLLFVSHPIETQAVTYIVQRFASLAALFYLAAFLAYIKFRLSARPLKRLVFYALTLALALLSLKTKEFAITLPVTVAVFELCFFRDSLRKRILYLVPLALLTIAVPLSFMETGKSILEATKIQTSISRLDYLFTQFTVIAMYMRLLLFPANQNLDYDHPLYESFFTPEVILSFLFLLSMVALGLFLLLRSRRKTREMRVAAFGIFWFFITILPESSLIPIVDLVFEHRVYLPSVGAFIAVAILAFSISHAHSDRIPILGKAVPALFVAVSLILCGATYKRNIVWKSTVTLWEDVVSKSPGKVRPHFNLGTTYSDAGQTEKAIEQLVLTLNLDPGHVKAYNNLGNAYISKGLTAKAIKNYESAVSVDPNFVDGLYNLGKAYGRAGQTEQAVEHYRRVLSLKPDHVDAHINLGNVYFSKGRTDMAIEQYESAAAIKPDFEHIYANLGNAYLSKGAADAAIENYERALSINANLPQVHYYLGIAYRKKGMPGKAEEHFRISGKTPQ